MTITSSSKKFFVNNLLIGPQSQMEGSYFRCEHSLWILTESIPFFECTKICRAQHV
jgi:hypothetical protein